MGQFHAPLHLYRDKTLGCRYSIFPASKLSALT